MDLRRCSPLDALIMAGGKGTRLRMGEKPMADLAGKRLIDRVLSALEGSSIERVFVAVTDTVPMTREWAASRGLGIIHTAGKGFVADMVEAVLKAGIKEPVLVIMADLPLMTSEVLDDIIRTYGSRPEPALSTHTPLELHGKIGRRPDSLFNYRGRLIVPSGVNILDGSRISEEQEDYHLILDCLELAANVNTQEDLLLCERILRGEIA